MASAITRDLGQFVSCITFDSIPEDAKESIKTAFADTIGVMIAGSIEPAPRLLKSVLAPVGNEATLIVGQGRASALDAAWIHGTAAHVLDYDDVAQQGGHPSAVLVPAIIAEAEALGATGAQMLVSYAAGYEVFSDLARRDADQHHDKGWHPTGIFGAIGAAAACASLRCLDTSKAAVAIALAASQSAGLMSNFGTMTKPFHAGRAAHAGVMSARLAAAGFTASPDAIEHPPGFLSAVSPKGRIDLDSPVRAGNEWQICAKNRVSIKKYPLCYGSHRAVDGVLDLKTAHPIDPSKVDRVTVSLSRRNIGILRNRSPQTALEGKFSMEFAMACALSAGRAGLAELTDEFVRRPEVQNLMKCVCMIPDDRDNPQRPGYALYDRVVLTMRDGREIDSGEIRNVRGDHDLPLRREELWTKFQDCLQLGNPRLSAGKIFDTVMSLERLPAAKELVHQLTAAMD